MQEITREEYAMRGSATRHINVWFYSADEDMVYRDYGDGNGVIAEMPYNQLKAMALFAPSLSAIPMRCTRELVRFVRNREKIKNV